MNKIMSLSILIFLGISGKVFSQTQMKLSAKEAQKSQQFKSLMGSNRMESFKSMQHLVITEAVGNKKSNAKKHITTRAEVILLLGPPNFQQSTETFGYYLTTLDKPCSVVFEFNQADQTKTYIINDCNQ